MTETEKNQIKGALLKCAEENENKFTLTGHIVISSLCKSAVERIEELEKENAELKEPKTRRMTNKELSRWLREKPTREYKYLTSNFICCDYDYREENQDKEAHEDILIREDDGEWKEPLVEV